MATTTEPTPGSRRVTGTNGMTAEQRKLRAQIAANARWSRYMAREDQAAAARAAIFARLEREVDPDDVLPPDQRAALVRSAARRMSAHMNAARARKRAARRQITA